MSDHGNDEAGKKHRHEHIMRRLEELLPNTLKSLIEHIDGDGEGDRDGDADADGDGNGNGNGDDFNYVDQGDYVGGADNTGGDCKDNSGNQIMNDSKDGDHQAEFKIGAIGHDIEADADADDGASNGDGVGDNLDSGEEDFVNQGEDNSQAHEYPPRNLVICQLFGVNSAPMSSSRSAGRDDSNRVIRHGIPANTGTDPVSGNAADGSVVDSAECIEIMSHLETAPITLDSASKVWDVEVPANNSSVTDRPAACSEVFLLANKGVSKVSKVGGQPSKDSLRKGPSALFPPDFDSGKATTKFPSNQAAAAPTDTLPLSNRKRKSQDGRSQKSVTEEPLQAAVSRQQANPSTGPKDATMKQWLVGRDAKKAPNLSTGAAAAAGNKKSFSQTGNKRAMKGTQASMGKLATQKEGSEAGKKRKMSSRTAAASPINQLTAGVTANKEPTLLPAGSFSPDKNIKLSEEGILLKKQASVTKKFKDCSDDEFGPAEPPAVNLAPRGKFHRNRPPAFVKSGKGGKAAAKAADARGNSSGESRGHGPDYEHASVTEKATTAGDASDSDTSSKLFVKSGNGGTAAANVVDAQGSDSGESAGDGSSEDPDYEAAPATEKAAIAGDASDATLERVEAAVHQMKSRRRRKTTAKAGDALDSNASLKLI